MYVVLTTFYPDNPNISDWLGIGLRHPRRRRRSRSSRSSTSAGFVWVFWQVRRRGGVEARWPRSRSGGRPTRDRSARSAAGLPEVGRRRTCSLDDLPAGARATAPPAPGAGGGRGLAAGCGAGRRRGRRDRARTATRDSSASFRNAVLARPVRADRSRALDSESTGRIDRLDLWFFIVVVIAALTLRTFRLAEPYSMHFDEVYHARTATEFLQDWRYGIPHDIYEYTHPHLAKYMMAARDRRLRRQPGHVAGQPRTYPSETPRSRARWDDPTMPDGRAGDRVYVATGSEVRAYDLATRGARRDDPRARRDRASPWTRALHRLYIGTDSGQILSGRHVRGRSTRSACSSRQRATGPPRRLRDARRARRATCSSPRGSTYVIAATAATTMCRARREHRPASWRPSQQRRRRWTSIQGAHQPAGRRRAGRRDRQAGRWRASSRSSSAGPPPTSRPSSRHGGSQVVLGPAPTASARASFDQAYRRRQAGRGVDPVPAADRWRSTPAGLSLLVPSTMESGPARRHPGRLGRRAGDRARCAADLRRRRREGRRRPAAERPEPTAAAPTSRRTIKMPGQAQQVAYDPSTNFVHVLGRTPDGSSATVYVIETARQRRLRRCEAAVRPGRVRGRRPAATTRARTARTSSRSRPTARRRASTSATTRSRGGCPGVILGALTAGLLYLLARTAVPAPVGRGPRRDPRPGRRHGRSSSRGSA